MATNDSITVDFHTEFFESFELIGQLKERDEQLYSLASVLCDRLRVLGVDTVAFNLAGILENMLTNHSDLSKLKARLQIMQEGLKNA